MYKLIDLHCHILPGVDDGSRNIETSESMCKIAAGDGIETIIATPHFIPGCSTNATKTQIADKADELNDYLGNRGIEIKVVPGMEVFMSPDIVELYRSGQLLTLNNSRYILIELPMQQVPLYTKDIIYQLQLIDLVPVIAHPERNCALQRNFDLIGQLVQQGALLQINSGSLNGLFGKAARNLAIKLVKRGLVHFIGSDAHTSNQRAPRIREACELASSIDKSFFDKVNENSFKLLNNKEIEAAYLPTKKVESKFSFLNFFGTVFKG